MNKPISNLNWVNRDEALSWPEGCFILIYRPGHMVKYSVCHYFRPNWLKNYTYYCTLEDEARTLFARLD